MNSLAPARRVQWSRRKFPFKTLEKKLHAVLALGGCAAVAGAALAVATPWGLGISPDSAVFIGAARSLARG